MKRMRIEGKKFNRLTCIKYVGTDNLYRSLFLFLCECGNQKIIDGSHVKNNITKSCGCLQTETRRESIRKARKVLYEKNAKVLEAENPC